MELVFKNNIYFSQFLCLNFNFLKKYGFLDLYSLTTFFRNFFSYEDVAILYFFQPLFIDNLG